jgi:hypothetical protein
VGKWEKWGLTGETGVCGGKPVRAGECRGEAVEDVSSEDWLVRRSGDSGGVNGIFPPCLVG